MDFAHVQRPAIEVLAIESVDGPIRFRVVTHFNESEASCLSSVPVGDEVHTFKPRRMLETQTEPKGAFVRNLRTWLVMGREKAQAEAPRG
jgi:hypothetical protein